ncbi:MAG TPA: gamma-glutamyl-gamma-aminobutyrate hydrolase family protein [Nitrospinota bacterium]|nr:gamma-glutamyl-gamma-aminobutyrate hydrolase family protein [Nitrospinota bacterium]|tara:strand:- start:83697 stop:84458 length:762 start_codon:yes stop_codon:yes gene_type:complete
MKKVGIPIIGVTTDTSIMKIIPNVEEETSYYIKRKYVDALVKSGGLPILIPPMSSAKRSEKYLDVIDGLLITGGWFDIDPKTYGEKPLPVLGKLQPERTRMEMRLIKKAVEQKIPILGICGGIQAINVTFGGSLFQDLKTQVNNALNHEQSPKPPSKTSHDVYLTAGSLIRKIAGKTRLKINSTHHQAIKETGDGVSVCAVAADNVVEAIELPGIDSFILGVQWHPEQLFETDVASRRLFKKFVKECVRGMDS